MYQGGGKPHNPPFRLPTFSNPSTSGNAISVPARHGSSSTHRTDATSASSSSSEQRGNSRRGGFSSGYGSSNYQSHPRALAPFRKPSSQGSHWNQGGAAAGNGFATTAPGNIDSYVNDFRDGQQPNWAGRKAEALQRDALGGGGAAPKAWERLDSIEADQERRKQEAADEAKALKETRERVKAQKEAHDLAKLNADEKKARAASRIHPSTASVAALPSACRTSSPSASNLQRRNNDKNEKIASAAEERQRKAQKETEDIDESDVEVQVKVSSSKKGKGKEPAREEYMEVSSPDSQSLVKKNKKKKAEVDLDALLQPNKHTSWAPTTSKPTRSSPRKSQQTITLDGTPSPVKRSRPSLIPPSSSEDTPEAVDLKSMIEQERKAEEKRAKADEAKDARKSKRVVTSPSSEDEDSEAAVRRNLLFESTQMDPRLQEEKRADPTTLCPFCSSRLPSDPSPKLIKLRAYLLAQPDCEDYPTPRNPLGKRMSVVQTANFCRLHEEERTVIPDGKARGWPTEIDWAGLPKRIDRQCAQRLSEIIISKMGSMWLEKAKQEWEAKGNKPSLLSEYASFDVEQPGYYGTRGHELIVATLTRLFITDNPMLTTFRSNPLDPSAYIRRVLVPETATQLIMADLQLEDEEAARQVLVESRAFGRALWKGGLEGKKEEGKFVREEEERESQEKEEERERRRENGKREKGKGKEREREREREGAEEKADREKEKRREVKRREAEIRARAAKMREKVSVADGSSSSDDEVVEERPAVARRKPLVGGGVAPAPTKRKTQQQLASTMALAIDDDDDDDDMEVIVRSSNSRTVASSPVARRKPAAASNSHSHRAPPPLPSSSSDEPLPRVKPKSSKPTSKRSSVVLSPSSAGNGSTKSSKRRKSTAPARAVPLDASDSGSDSRDSDGFIKEVKTNFKGKGGKVAAPWKKGKASKRKGAEEDDPPPPSTDDGSDMSDE